MKTITGILKVCTPAIVVFCLGGCHYTPSNKRPVEEMSHRFHKECVEGHVYFVDSRGYTGYMSIKLDAEGKPTRCEG